ncbi:hypothetical protein X975_10544, partial [Stegodyphus mimosarum]
MNQRMPLISGVSQILVAWEHTKNPDLHAWRRFVKNVSNFTRNLIFTLSAGQTASTMEFSTNALMLCFTTMKRRISRELLK